MLIEKKQIAKIDSIKLAEYIAFKCGKLSHLKLQKLLYYVQALHLAYFDQALIDDDFEAWVHGPVSRKLYNNLKDHSVLYDELAYMPDPGEIMPDKYLQQVLTVEQIELIDEVLDEYGKLSSFQLETISHREAPWIEARQGYAAADRCNEIIPKERMLSFYKSEVYGETEN